MRKDVRFKKAVRVLARAPYWAVGRILLDLVLWVTAAALALRAGTPWAAILAIAFIGAIPLHDLLVHGHDGTHRLISRLRWANEFFLWLSHAVSGISGTAYRAFHLDHHRFAQTDRDPEVRRVGRGFRDREDLERICSGCLSWVYRLGKGQKTHPDVV